MGVYRRDVLAGIEAGVVAGLAMLCWFVIAMPAMGRPWYLILNLIAARFYTDRHVLLAPGFVTCSGAAWLIVGSGAMGILTVVARGGWLLGLTAAAVWYAASYLFVWNRVSPLLLTYTPQPVLIAGFLLYGSVLGWRARRHH